MASKNAFLVWIKAGGRVVAKKVMLDADHRPAWAEHVVEAVRLSGEHMSMSERQLAVVFDAPKAA